MQHLEHAARRHVDAQTQKVRAEEGQQQRLRALPPTGDLGLLALAFDPIRERHGTTVAGIDIGRSLDARGSHA